MQLDPTQARSDVAGRSQQVTRLTERARDGDKTAFEQLIYLFQEEIFRMVFYRTYSRMDAEDLTQDVFLLAYKNLPGLKDIDRFRPWLFSIAVNRVRDFHRRKRILSIFSFSDTEREQEISDSDVHAGPGFLHQLMEHELWERIKGLSSRFSPMEREVFFLRFMDHLSIKEISEVLGKSESAVKTHLYRALRKFKEDPAFVRMLKGEES